MNRAVVSTTRLMFSCLNALAGPHATLAALGLVHIFPDSLPALAAVAAASHVVATSGTLQWPFTEGSSAPRIVALEHREVIRCPIPLDSTCVHRWGGYLTKTKNKSTGGVSKPWGE